MHFLSRTRVRETSNFPRRDETPARIVKLNFLPRPPAPFIPCSDVILRRQFETFLYIASGFESLSRSASTRFWTRTGNSGIESKFSLSFSYILYFPGEVTGEDDAIVFHRLIPQSGRLLFFEIAQETRIFRHVAVQFSLKFAGLLSPWQTRRRVGFVMEVNPRAIHCEIN